MALKTQFLSLPDLIDLYESQEVQQNKEEKQELLLLMLTHQEIKSTLKNQSLIIKKIFTYQHLAKLIEFLKEENMTHAQQLKNVKYDPSGENIPMCLKLPFMAMEILCCECQLINEMLFVGNSQNSTPLLPNLLEFFDHPQHYHLACYFSKVMTAITKRVSSPTHKYNLLFAKWIFGSSSDQDSMRKSCLFKSIKHFYSLSTIEYVSKWLLISSRQAQIVEINGEQVQRTILNFRRALKIFFLQELIKVVNKNLLDQETLTNISALFESMLSQSEKMKKIPALGLKSLGPSMHAPKTTLYELAVQELIISDVFLVPDQGCLTLAKLNLIKVYINRYTWELQSLTNQREDEEQSPRKLLEIINSDNLFYVFEWMIEYLKIVLLITTKQISNENSPMMEEQSIENSRVTLPSPEKMVILQVCELIRKIHSIDSCKIQLTQYYNDNSSVLVSLIKRLMSLQNNLIQLETSKIVLSMIKPEQKFLDINVPYDFARKLLLHSILQLIENDNIRAHVIEWADTLLSIQMQHIFEDYEEEFQWEHIREIVEQAKQIHVGQFKMIQANIDFFYSEEKARQKYSHFLEDFKSHIQYEDKKEFKSQSSQNKLDTIESSKQISLKEDGQSSEFNMFFFSDPNDNYLKFNIDTLIDQL